MNGKRGELLNQVLIQIILIGIVFAIFFFAIAERVNARGVKQQVLEKEIALLIDSAEPGMSFEVSRKSLNGIIQDIEVREGKIFVTVDGLKSVEGYPYFSLYSVFVAEDDLQGKFRIEVK